MFLEDEVLGQTAYQESALLRYGFVRTKNGFSYQRLFMDGSFRAEVYVDRAGHAEARCVDCESEERYTPIYVDTHAGAFVSEVRRQYLDVLRDFVASCGEKLPFLMPQSNRIAKYFDEKYGEKPDFPFKEDDVDGVFRNPANRKWYALIMRLRRGKFEKSDSDEIIEVINFKASCEDHEALVQTKGFYRAYHMGKSTWLSVILDDSVPDAQLLIYLERSRAFTLGKTAKTNASTATRETGAHKSWLIPANYHYYDVDKAFSEREIIEWKQSSHVMVGDTVYLYISSPISAIVYQCEVMEADIPFHYQDANIQMNKVMRIKKRFRYPQDAFPFERLKTFGVTSIRGPRNIPEDLLRALESYQGSSV